jgi:hypothetical protein
MPLLVVPVPGDGDQDLLVGSADGSITYFENVGSPTSLNLTRRTSRQDNPFFGVVVPGGYSSPSLGDIDQVHSLGVPKACTLQTFSDYMLMFAFRMATWI